MWQHFIKKQVTKRKHKKKLRRFLSGLSVDVTLEQKDSNTYTPATPSHNNSISKAKHNGTMFKKKTFVFNTFETKDLAGYSPPASPTAPSGRIMKLRKTASVRNNLLAHGTTGLATGWKEQDPSDNTRYDFSRPPMTQFLSCEPPAKRQPADDTSEASIKFNTHRINITDLDIHGTMPSDGRRRVTPNTVVHPEKSLVDLIDEMFCNFMDWIMGASRNQAPEETARMLRNTRSDPSRRSIHKASTRNSKPRDRQRSRSVDHRNDAETRSRRRRDCTVNSSRSRPRALE